MTENHGQGASLWWRKISDALPGDNAGADDTCPWVKCPVSHLISVAALGDLGALFADLQYKGSINGSKTMSLATSTSFTISC